MIGEEIFYVIYKYDIYKSNVTKLFGLFDMCCAVRESKGA